MSFLGRLLGKEPPRVPAGGHAFVSLNGDAWSVRVSMGVDPPTNRCKRISPVFDRQTDAYAYLAWINGGPTFKYPAGAA